MSSGSDNDRGYFLAKIPLSVLLGFCRNVQKIMYGVKWSLFAQRRLTDDQVIHHKDGSTSTSKFALSKLSLWMTKVTLSTEAAAAALEWMLARNSLAAY